MRTTRSIGRFRLLLPREYHCLLSRFPLVNRNSEHFSDFRWLELSLDTQLKALREHPRASSNISGLDLFYGADWTVTADGFRVYDVEAKATEPWNIFPTDLSTITGPTYSLYIPFSMLGGDSDLTANSSGFGFEVDYNTASSSTTLLDVEVSNGKSVVTVSDSFGSDLKFFLEPDSATSPIGSVTPGIPIDASDLATLISGDVQNGNLVSPINLGIVLSGIPIPMTLLGNGSVAQIDETAIALQSGVPEPSTWVLMALGLAGLGTLGVRRRAISAALHFRS
jgi:PEP-CTERM motif